MLRCPQTVGRPGAVLFREKESLVPTFMAQPLFMRRFMQKKKVQMKACQQERPMETAS